MLVGAWHEAQEDEGLGQPNEQVEPGCDNVPLDPGLSGGAAQPHVLFVLVTAELEDEAVEDGGEEDGAQEDAESGQMEGVEEGEEPVWAAGWAPGPAEAAVVQGPALPVQESAESEGGGEERHASRHEEEEGPPLGGRQDGGGVADVHPAVDRDGDVEEPSDQRGGEGDGDPDRAVEGGVETPVVEEPCPVEDVGDVGEPQEAVQPDQLVDGGGAGLRPDRGKDCKDEDKDDGTAKDSNARKPGGGKVGHRLAPASGNWEEQEATEI